MAENRERDRLFKKYPYIVAWGQLLGSYGYYIEKQCRTAEKDNAPSDSIFRNDDGTWRILSECKKETQDEVEQYKLGHKGGVIFN